MGESTPLIIPLNPLDHREGRRASCDNVLLLIYMFAVSGRMFSPFQGFTGFVQSRGMDILRYKLHIGEVVTHGLMLTSARTLVKVSTYFQGPL